MEQTICGNCIYWKIYSESEVPGNLGLEISNGECRRYPPTASENRSHIRPEAREDNWCGEFIEAITGVDYKNLSVSE